MKETATLLPEGHQWIGNIGGRIYFNLSINYSISAKFGQSPKKGVKYFEQSLGIVPDGITLPVMKLSWLSVFKLIGSLSWYWLNNLRRSKQHTLWMLEECEQWCEAKKQQVKQLSSPVELKEQKSEVEEVSGLSFFCLIYHSNKFLNKRTRTKSALEKHLSEADAETLLTGLGGDSYLESMGPLFGIADVINGDLSREDFTRKYGHRGPDEGEFAIPRPGEDPEWIDRLIVEWRSQGDKLSEMMATQNAKREAIWARLQSKNPKQYLKLKKMVEITASYAQKREQVRSEVTRSAWVLRALMLKIGDIFNLGEDVFFLRNDEAGDLLNSGTIDRERITMRKESHRIYKALPPLPNLISGQIYPEQWAKNPNRRLDYYDSHVSAKVDENELISGFPGASGVVDGTVRVLNSYHQSSQFREGEILVASVTNVGWTPIFPRAIAIITDIGAPLSHATIIAREMGIPAVVGTGNATRRLKTGDRVKVIGEKGIVEILEKSRE